MDSLTVFLIVGGLVWVTVAVYILLLLFFPEWVGISGGSLFKKKEQPTKDNKNEIQKS